VEEERVFSNGFSVSNMNTDQILVWMENKALSDAGKRALQQIVDMKKQITDLDAQSKTIDKQIDNLDKDQDRTRQNIASLNQVSGQQQQVEIYAKKLADQENQLAKLRDQQNDVQQKRTAAQSSLDSFMERIEF
jgi:chromosome segregation ATPase